MTAATQTPNEPASFYQDATLYEKNIIYDRGNHDFAMFLGGELVGFARDYHSAEVALDQLVYDLQHSGLTYSAGELDAGDVDAVEIIDPTPSDPPLPGEPTPENEGDEPPAGWGECEPRIGDHVVLAVPDEYHIIGTVIATPDFTEEFSTGPVPYYSITFDCTDGSQTLWTKQNEIRPVGQCRNPDCRGPRPTCGAPATTMTLGVRLCPACQPRTMDEAFERAIATAHIPLPSEERYRHKGSACITECANCYSLQPCIDDGEAYICSDQAGCKVRQAENKSLGFIDDIATELRTLRTAHRTALAAGRYKKANDLKDRAACLAEVYVCGAESVDAAVLVEA